MSSISELRKQLEVNWDATGDGQVDSDDLLAAFDRDGDGSLDRDELAKLAQQLAQQVEYNNMLLSELRNLEEGQLAAQRDMKEKQNALKQAIQVGDAARADSS